VPLIETDYIAARLRDFWGRRTPWQRRLWGIGTVGLVEEVLEAAAFQRAGHFHERTVADLAESARRQIRRDPGLGSPPVRGKFDQLMKVVAKDGGAMRELQALLHDRAPHYFACWRSASATEPPELEVTARNVGAHLLGCGFSPDHLYRWVSSVAGDGTLTVPAFLEEAETLAQRPTRTYEVLIPITSLPRHRVPMPANWMEARAAAEWIRTHGPAGKTVRQNGALLFTREARDPWRAVEEVSDVVQSLAARVVIGLPGQDRFVVHDEAVVSASPRLYPLRRPRRQVEVHALYRQGVLYEASHSGLAGRIGAAIDLLEPLENGSPEAAVAGGWAAIETLLARRDAANAVAAEELATLVACSLVRAELTTLSYSYAIDHRDQLSETLDGTDSNLDRCRILLRAITAGEVIDFANPSDTAALARLKAIAGAPADVLGRVASYVGDTFKRLYRQRNLVLHAGRSNSVAMLPTLRGAPPLVGAAIDRIVHAALQPYPIAPDDLVARARIRLHLAGTTAEADLVDLLG
jgi:hypothetical protein